MAKDEEKVSVEFTKKELDYYLESLKKVQSNYAKGSELAGMIALLRDKLIRASDTYIENLEKALVNYKRFFGEQSGMCDNETVVKTLAYIDNCVDLIKSSLKVMDTVDEVGDESDNIVDYTLTIERHLVELHRFYGGSCWQLETVSMEMSTALHDLLTAYNLY